MRIIFRGGFPSEKLKIKSISDLTEPPVSIRAKWAIRNFFSPLDKTQKRVQVKCRISPSLDGKIVTETSTILDLKRIPLEKLGVVMRWGFWNPCPIADQDLRFHLPCFRPTQPKLRYPNAECDKPLRQVHGWRKLSLSSIFLKHTQSKTRVYKPHLIAYQNG